MWRLYTDNDMRDVCSEELKLLVGPQAVAPLTSVACSMDPLFALYLCLLLFCTPKCVLCMSSQQLRVGLVRIHRME